MRKNKVPPENIITFAYDDIANNPNNPFKGKVFQDDELDYVYKGVVIDYRGEDVTKNNFLKVLKGDNKLEANKKKVLKSGHYDNVFIFYSGHGGNTFVTLPDADSDVKKLTLEQQYQEVKKRTSMSHVMKYGEMAMGSLPVGKFQDHYDLLMNRNDGPIESNTADRNPSCLAHLFSKSRRLMEGATGEEDETAWRRLHRALQYRNLFVWWGIVIEYPW
ncbi:hypothetical protein T265_15720, partial [Opisthorchis viverrini]